MWEYNNTDELYHYGILGMKWGVRHDKKSSSKPRKRKRKVNNYSDDVKEYRQIKKKKVSQMSNAELKKLNERRNLETNYHNLNKSKIAKGIAYVGAAATAIGTIDLLYRNYGRLVDDGKEIIGKIKYRQLKLF